MQINAKNIPEELRQIAQWCMWRTITRDGKDTKIPFQPNEAPAKSNDPETWCTFTEAMEAYNKGGWDGIGFVFSSEDPYVGIDLDGCRDIQTGVVAPWARSLILELASYAEVSPSRTGVKIWVRGGWTHAGGHKVTVKDAPRLVDKTPAIEIYDSLRYFTVTGQRLAGQSVIADRQEQLDAIRNRFWENSPVPSAAGHNEWRSESAVIDRARKYLQKMEVSVSGQDGHGKAFKAACVLVLGFELSQDDALQLLREWNQGCQPPWSERELLHKVESAGQQNGERGYLRNVAPQNYHHVPVPEYRPAKKKVDEPVANIQVTTMEEAARRYHERLTAGNIKLIDLGLPDLDYALGGGVEAGEMIIFAGRPSHGKSMTAQQVAQNFTAAGTPVVFISEEMSHLAIGKRAIQYASAVPGEYWGIKNEAVANDISTHFAERKPCYIIEGCRTVDRVAEQIRHHVDEFGAGLAIVDYAQQLAGISKNRHEEIARVSRTLKHVGSECNIPMIVLAQMSRDIEKRPQFIPVMSDLKESGQLEQDADVIVFMVWPFKIDPSKDRDEYLMFVAKNRNRPINETCVKCKFIPQRQQLVYVRPSLPDGIEFGQTASPTASDMFSELDGNFR